MPIMRNAERHIRLLAIDPTSKGFGFVVVEHGTRLVDWGVARVWATSEMEFVVRVQALIERYGTAFLVLPKLPSEPRRARASRRLAALSLHAQQFRMQVASVSPSDVGAALPGTKQRRAESLASAFPELRAWLPPPRRPWMTEDERMHIFDALALAMTALSQDVARSLRGRHRRAA